MTDEELLDRAKKRVGMKMAFYTHLLVFVCVNLGLYVINQVKGGQPWHMFPLLGWGIGLAAHGIVTFLSLNGEGLRERMLADEVEKLKGRR